MFVVMGASGRAGGETARALMQAGARVRVVLRRAEQAQMWAPHGADVAIAAIEDAQGLAAALRGASGAFLLSPPPVDGDPFVRAGVIGQALAQAVQQAEVERVVVLSSIGAQHATGTGVIGTLHTLERHLYAAAPSVTFLRPGYFVETWGEVMASVIADGILPSFLDTTQKIPMVSTVDVGRTAADLLLHDSLGQRVLELRGPQDWSADDVAKSFGEVLGRRVEARLIPSDARTQILAEAGVPPQIAISLLAMYDGIASGRVEHEEGRELRRGYFTLKEALERIVRATGAGGSGQPAQAVHG
jgi:uncharacterized protein YbjT (DUF2867 family)